MSGKPELWRVQLWLGDALIEEHIGPPELAQQYANVLQLRVAGLPRRRILAERVIDPGLSATSARNALH